MNETQNFSRRAFLSATTAGAAVVAIGESSVASGADANSDKLLTLTPETFLKYLGTPFVVQNNSTPATTVVLHKVTKFSPKKKADNKRPAFMRKQFSVVWRGARGSILKHGMYRVDHAELGSFQLFVGPVSSPKQPLVLEAVFG